MKESKSSVRKKIVSMTLKKKSKITEQVAVNACRHA